MEHYSERLKRNFIDEDFLSIYEAKAVLSLNSGRNIGHEYVFHIARIKRVEVMQISARMHLYLYRDLKNLEVKATSGRRLSDNPSPCALRQRAFRKRQQEKREKGK